MIIHLKQGIDKLRFGMTRPEVERIYGKPDRALMDSEDENELIWEYTAKKLRLTFYQNEADRLGYIRSSNSKLTINKLTIIDSKIEDLRIAIDPNTENWEKEDYDTFQCYFHESHWLTLNVQYERVTDVELGVPFKNENEYDWPK